MNDTLVAAGLAGPLLLHFFLAEVAAGLNDRSLAGKLPEDCAGLYEPERYTRSLAYHRARARLSRWREALSLAALLIFWGAGGFGFWDGLVRHWVSWGTGRGLLFVGGLALGVDLFLLPFSWVQVFGVEERFGFNRTTPRVFVMDRIKSYALVALIGGPVLAGLWGLVGMSPWGWVLAWAASTLVRLTFQVVGPVLIMPLFHKFQPLKEGELREAILTLARQLDFPIQGVYELDGSKRSSKANAFFAGWGQFRRIALFDTLIQRHTVPELRSVLAHEIGHEKLKHIFRQWALSTALEGVFWLAVAGAMRWSVLWGVVGLPQPSVAAAWLLTLVLGAPWATLGSVLSHALSRRHEFEADRYAAQQAGGPQPMIAALRRLASTNFAPLNPHPLHVALYDTHPPVPQRLRVLASLRRDPS